MCRCMEKYECNNYIQAIRSNKNLDAVYFHIIDKDENRLPNPDQMVEIMPFGGLKCDIKRGINRKSNPMLTMQLPGKRSNKQITVRIIFQLKEQDLRSVKMYFLRTK